MNQCWNIVNSNRRNKLQWNSRRNSFIFILENTFENVVCEMASIWPRSQWVDIRLRPYLSGATEFIYGCCSPPVRHANMFYCWMQENNKYQNSEYFIPKWVITYWRLLISLIIQISRFYLLVTIYNYSFSTRYLYEPLMHSFYFAHWCISFIGCWFDQLHFKYQTISSFPESPFVWNAKQNNKIGHILVLFNILPKISFAIH